MKRAFATVVSCLLATSVAGCGGSSMGDVTGQVTLDGEPVTGLVVRFLPQPKEGGAFAETKSAFGEVDGKGRYRLSTKGEYDGAGVGRHRVTITPLDESRPPVGQLPADYFVEVQSGTNQIDIELQPFTTN